MGHGEGMAAWLKQVSQKEFLPLLVKYLYQHVCLRPKNINTHTKKKKKVKWRSKKLHWQLSFFCPIKLGTFLVESELVGTQIDQQD